MKLLVTAEMEVEDAFVYDPASIEQDIVDECIAIKSGAYENTLWGNVISVQKILRKDA
jgi:hypothetical protein